MDADLEQGSSEWLAARAGSLGASDVHRALARTRNGWGAERANVAAALVIERLTGQPRKGFTSAAMQWGIDTEPEARAVYAMSTSDPVSTIGLVRHPSIVGTHASPDGLVGADGLVEIKCPESAQHLATLLGEAPADRYVTQCLWQMECTGRAWCDLVSYDPRFPPDMAMHVTRLVRDDARLSEMREAVRAFLAEVDASLARLLQQYRQPMAAE